MALEREKHIAERALLTIDEALCLSKTPKAVKSLEFWDRPP
jgi:hypothetical protein